MRKVNNAHMCDYEFTSFYACWYFAHAEMESENSSRYG